MHAEIKHPPQSETNLTDTIYPHPMLAAAKIPSGKRAVIHKLTVLLLTILSLNIFGCGGGGNGGAPGPRPTPSPTGSAVKLTKITLTPAQVKVPCGMSEQLQALGTYSDGSSQDITQKAEWKCSPGKIAGAEGGEVRGLAVGEAEVTAALNGVTSGKAKITVTDAKPIGYIISASGVNVSGKLQLNAGETQQLRVRALLSDGSGADVTGSVIWGSDNIKAASVSEQGVITAKQPGTANITIKDAAGKIIGELRVTVAAAEVTAVSISKTKLTVAAGYTEIISAAASYSDGSTVDVSGSAAWRSSDPSIADAEVKKASGRTRVTVIARKPGQTVISASFAGKTASCAVKVTDAELVSMVIEPASLTIAHGLTANLTVKGGFSDGTGRDITDDCRFFTSNENIAIAESAGRNTTAGLVHGVGKGTAVITAKKGGSKAEARVTVSDAAVTSLSLSSESDSVIAGYTLEMTAAAAYSDGSRSSVNNAAEWTSGSPKTAAVDDKGIVRGLTPGTAVISVKFGGKTASKEITVSKAAVTSFDIDAGSGSVIAGYTLNLTATAAYSDGSSGTVTDSVKWKSGDTGKATVDSHGTVTGRAPGKATITAEFEGKTYTAEITVSSAVVTKLTITPAEASVITGHTVALTAKADFSDGQKDVDVTDNDNIAWSSAVPEQVIVDSQNGQVTGAAPTDNPVTVTAVIDDVEAAAAITVPSASALTLLADSVQVNDGDTLELTLGAVITMQAGAVFSDGQTEDDALPLIEWTFGDPDTAEIDEEKGELTGLAAGETTVTAAIDDQKISFSLSVIEYSETVLTREILTEQLGYAFSGSSLTKDGAPVTELDIPETYIYDGRRYKVTAIGEAVFYGCKNITSVTIPESVTSIGAQAFFDCDGLKSAIIPESVTTIGGDAFGGPNVLLDSATVPCDLLGSSGSPRAHDITITPGTSKTIGAEALYESDWLTSATICGDIKSIGASAFERTGLTEISIPGSVQSIGDKAFNECALKSITLSDGVKTIGNYAFSRNYVTELIIPGSVQSIGNYAFYDSSELTSVTIPDSVKTIGEGAFGNSGKLASVTLPSGIKCSGDDVPFSNCDKLTTAVITLSSVPTIEGSIFSYSSLTSVTIPKGITSIKDSAFRGCGALTSIDIPDSVDFIGDYAFSESGLTELTIPGSVKTIGKGAFSSCYSLTELTISDGVATIGDEAFYYCDGVDSVTIPDSVKTIGSDAFYNMPQVYYNGSAAGSPWGAKKVSTY